MTNKSSIDTILMVEYFKVTKEESDNPIFIMILNKQNAYKMGIDGKWIFQPGLYNYLFANSDDENDFQIEPIDVMIASDESLSRQKKLVKRS